MVYRNAMWFAANLFLFSSAASLIQAKEDTGLSLTKPARGPYVKTDRGYMIPYRSTIPGAEVAFEMVPVAGGVFSLRGEGDRSPVNDLQSSARIEPFWIGRYEVTWSEYNVYYALRESFSRFERLGVRKVTQENQIDAITAPSELYEPLTYFPSANKREWDKHPAVGMTQFAAKQYTKCLSKLTGKFYRLPSEVEWEFACRAGSSKSYCFGDDKRKLSDYAWYANNSAGDTHPVGLKKPNRWGLHDMHGNASEWVLDQFSNAHPPLNRNAPKGDAPIHWPTRLHPRTVRGGSWDSSDLACRSNARRGSSADWHEEEPQFPPSPHWLAFHGQRRIGFRIARPLNPPSLKSYAKFWEADVEELKKAVAEYASNGHSQKGIVDSKLPSAIRQLKE